MYDAMAEKKGEKDKVEDKEMSVDGEKTDAGESKKDAVKEEGKSEDDKEEQMENKEEEEAAEGDEGQSPLKLWIFQSESEMFEFICNFSV